MRILPFTLVVQGGSVRGIYASGVLDAFLEEGIMPSLALGTSAGALVLASYLSGGYQEGQKTMLTMVEDGEFMSLRNFVKKDGLFDFDYLFSKFARREELLSSPTYFYAVATKLENARSVLFEKNDQNFFKGLAASCSLPLFASPVEISGSHYLDGGVAAPIAIHEAMGMGDNPLIVISTREKGYRKKSHRINASAVLRGLYERFPLSEEKIKHPERVYNPLFDELDFLDEKGDLLAIYPSKPLRVKTTERNPEVLNEAYKLGRSDAKGKMRGILAFLSKTRPGRI